MDTTVIIIEVLAAVVGGFSLLIIAITYFLEPFVELIREKRRNLSREYQLNNDAEIERIKNELKQLKDENERIKYELKTIKNIVIPPKNNNNENYNKN
jgi:cell shape-determining protein MreC